jgi:IS30 family transposase
MDMQKSTLITLCWELDEQGVPKTHIAKELSRHQETIHVWVESI